MRRRLGFVLAIAVVVVLAAALRVPAVRDAVLTPLGTALVVNDPLRPVDAIVVTLDAEAAGALEAADLVAAGVARQVLLFDEAPGAAEQEIVRRGLAPSTRSSEQAALLGALGVRAVARVPDASASSGTTVESRALAAWCAAHGLRSVLVITTPDHSRRVRRVMTRALAPLGTDVVVRGATHVDFHPQAWWHTIDGRRIVAIEWQKLMLDVMSHPL